jgi:hypothetical protein
VHSIGCITKTRPTARFAQTTLPNPKPVPNASLSRHFFPILQPGEVRFDGTPHLYQQFGILKVLPPCCLSISANANTPTTRIPRDPKPRSKFQHLGSGSSTPQPHRLDTPRKHTPRRSHISFMKYAEQTDPDQQPGVHPKGCFRHSGGFSASSRTLSTKGPILVS